MNQENEDFLEKGEHLENEDDSDTLFSRETLIEKNARNMEIAESMFDNDSLTEGNHYQAKKRKATIEDNDLLDEDE